MSNGGDSTLGFGTSNANGPLLNGGGSVVDTNVVFNTSLTSIESGSTITLTENSTRPQSVWYTVSASGTVGGSSGTSATQVPYTPTADENNNIFAITTGKIPGALNDGVGGVGGVSLLDSSIYTTAVGGRPSATGSNTSDGTNGIAVAQPDKGSLVTNATTTDITLSQNYLPLGITANVKDAYFNHNGII